MNENPCTKALESTNGAYNCFYTEGELGYTESEADRDMGNCMVGIICYCAVFPVLCILCCLYECTKYCTSSIFSAFEECMSGIYSSLENCMRYCRKSADEEESNVVDQVVVSNEKIDSVVINVLEAPNSVDLPDAQGNVQSLGEAEL